MKILNLYAGIGGNRKLWGDEHKVTAVELNPSIAAIYQDFFPNDTVISGDAHKYLLEHYKEFDFIWSSPPCPTHSIMKLMCVFSDHGSNSVRKAEYADMTLYQEIILLKYFSDSKTMWVVENVNPYYEPLIPATKLERHMFWSNFNIYHFDSGENKMKIRRGKPLEQINDGKTEIYGFYIDNYNIKDKRKILRNLVNPELGLHILNCAIGKKPIKTNQIELNL